MAVPSTMLELGTPLPHFALPDAHGELVDLEASDGSPATVVMFLCNHCPYVRHIAEELGRTTQRLLARGVAVYGINSNDAEAYPDDSPAKMLEMAAQHAWDFPYLVDADQQVARRFRAACTPDLYVFDGARKLFYRGQFDSSRPSSDAPVTGQDLLRAVDAVIAQHPAPEEQLPSIGCSIKWKPGNQPEWFG